MFYLWHTYICPTSFTFCWMEVFFFLNINISAAWFDLGLKKKHSNSSSKFLLEQFEKCECWETVVYSPWGGINEWQHQDFESQVWDMIWEYSNSFQVSGKPGRHQCTQSAYLAGSDFCSGVSNLPPGAA